MRFMWGNVRKSDETNIVENKFSLKNLKHEMKEMTHGIVRFLWSGMIDEALTRRYFLYNEMMLDYQ